MVNRKTTGNYFYREEKCDVTKIQICEIIGLVSIFRKHIQHIQKEEDEKRPLAKNQPVSASW